MQFNNICRWNFISANPNTLGHTISNYINSTKTIKKLQLHTKVEWDWNNLKNALVSLIRRSDLIMIVPQRIPPVAVVLLIVFSAQSIKGTSWSTFAICATPFPSCEQL
jgi:hypothetical protein